MPRQPASTGCACGVLDLNPVPARSTNVGDIYNAYILAAAAPASPPRLQVLTHEPFRPPLVQGNGLQRALPACRCAHGAPAQALPPRVQPKPWPSPSMAGQAAATARRRPAAAQAARCSSARRPPAGRAQTTGAAGSPPS